MLVEGVITPVFGSIVKPAGAAKVPPGNAPGPFMIVGVIGVAVWQNAAGEYEIVAVGNGWITIVLDADTSAHPPAAAIVFVIIYVPGGVLTRSTCPVDEVVVPPTNSRPGVAGESV